MRDGSRIPALCSTRRQAIPALHVIGNNAAPRDGTCRCWNDTSNVHFANSSDSNADAD